MKRRNFCQSSSGFVDAFGPLLLALFAVATTAHAQWATQTISLRQGWNAVFLEVQPTPADCDVVFSNAPIESVWMWNKRFTTVQYIADPNTLLPGQPDWLTYLPPSSTNSAVTSLFTVRGGQPYLIKSATATTLTIRGVPTVRNPDWLAESFNLVGFYISSNTAPSFLNFFAASPAHVGQPAFRLNAAGSWVQVTSPSTTFLSPGECYWVRSSAPSSFGGPARIVFEQGRSLDYARTLVEQTVRIQNRSSNTTTFTLKKLVSASPPVGHKTALAGEVPLSYWYMNLASNQVGWVVLSNQVVSPALAPGAKWSVRLAVRRPDMTSFALPPGVTAAAYQSLLELTDTLGTRALIPVSANGLQTYSPSAGLSLPHGVAAITPPPPDPRAGLWIGSVVLDQVNQAGVATTPVPTASQFQFRLILHVDNVGTTRLLQKVIVAWTNGVYATNQSGYRETVTPGRYVLVTDEALLNRFSGSAIRDGTVTGNRVSSAAFGFTQPLLMTRTGNFGETNGSFSVAVPMGFDDAVNPFKHRYHPDHNNLNDRYDSVLAEAPDVNRQISFQFTAADPDNTTLAGWGDNQLGGTYAERITGLHKFPINTQGTFRIIRASSVPTLNDAAF